MFSKRLTVKPFYQRPILELVFDRSLSTRLHQRYHSEAVSKEGNTTGDVIRHTVANKK